MAGIRVFFVKNLLSTLKSRIDYTNLLLARRGFERLTGRFNGPLDGFTYTPDKIGDMKIEWVTPDGADANKVLLYFHGGGYATGSINTHRAQVSQIAKAAGIKALIIDYRLAPENKYPAAIEDAVEAYHWLLRNGYSNKDICFGGDSAGGGLTVCTLLYLRDRDIPLPNCAIALSPWLDHTMTGESYLGKKDIDPMLVAEGMPIWSKHYTGEADPKSPYISPIFADLHNLPPIYIQVGEDEMLLDDSTRFAEKANAEGDHVKLEVYPEMFHVFQAFWRVLPISRQANAKLGEFLKQHLN
jgi:monoterpene epsilon-lactone hydrolase